MNSYHTPAILDWSEVESLTEIVGTVQVESLTAIVGTVQLAEITMKRENSQLQSTGKQESSPRTRFLLM
jgi:hypothetical protein